MNPENQTDRRGAAPDVVIVTGAAGNLGQALCDLLASRGSRVVAVQRRAANLPTRSGPQPALVVDSADLTDADCCVRVVAQVSRTFGRIDGLAHTVGGFAMADVATAGAELWNEMWRVNLLSAANMIRAVWHAMQVAGGGSIVAVGAQPALHAGAGMAAYAGAKAALLRLVEAAAEEGEPHSIRVNAVLPRIIDTPQNRAAMPTADTAKWATPDQVASAIAFLLSDAASGITGAQLAVTGRS